MECETSLVDKEKLLKDEKFNKTKSDQLATRVKSLTEENFSLEAEQSRLKTEIEEKRQ